jgi:hypothetical protein
MKPDMAMTPFPWRHSFMAAFLMPRETHRAMMDGGAHT